MEEDMDAAWLPRWEPIRDSSLSLRRMILRHKKRKATETNATSVLWRKDKIPRYDEPAKPLFSELPEELVLEIFSRLPPESIFRSRTVSKSWLSLSSEAFHFNKHLQPTVRGLFYNSHTGVEFVNLSSGAEEAKGHENFSASPCLQELKAPDCYNRLFYDKRIPVDPANIASAPDKVEVDENLSAAPCLEGFKVVDYCNGLLLLQSTASLVDDLHVFNPMTSTLFSLGFFSDLVPYRRSHHVLISLAFDPQMPSLFRLVCVAGCEEEEVVTHSRIFVYSFEKGNCVGQKECGSDMVAIYSSRSAFLDGKVHCMTQGGKLLSIDPTKCSYEVMCGPNLNGTTVIELGHSRGLLHCLSYNLFDHLLFIWVLESYAQEKWTMKYQLSLHQIYFAHEPHLGTFEIFYDLLKHKVAFHPHKEILFLPLGVSAGFLSFDLTTGKRELVVCNSSGDTSYGCWVDTPCFSV